MPEESEIRQPGPVVESAGGADQLDKLMSAVRRLESLLDQVLGEHAALREEHHKLRQDYRALRARNESVGEQLDDAIGRLKHLMAAESLPGDGE